MSGLVHAAGGGDSELRRGAGRERGGEERAGGGAAALGEVAVHAAVRPHDPRLAVHTAWDLGIADSTVIWFIQVCGRETRVIDVLKGEGVGLDYYANEVKPGRFEFDVRSNRRITDPAAGCGD